MEMVYRGYPQQSRPGVWNDRRWIEAEYEYIRGLYPLQLRKWQRFIEEDFDRNDGPDSRIYDEWPDREWLYSMRSRIMRNGTGSGHGNDEDAVMVMLLHEMLRRRMKNNLPVTR